MRVALCMLFLYRIANANHFLQPAPKCKCEAFSTSVVCFPVFPNWEATKPKPIQALLTLHYSFARFRSSKLGSTVFHFGLTGSVLRSASRCSLSGRPAKYRVNNWDYREACFALLPGNPLVGGNKDQPNAGTPCLAIFICSISLKQAWLNCVSFWITGKRASLCFPVFP